MAKRKPSDFSIVIADSVSTGHANAGLFAYKELEKLTLEGSGDDAVDTFQRKTQFAVTAFTNMLLGLEVLLKLHHFQHTGKYPSGHDIRILGSTFPDPTMDRLRAEYVRLIADQSVPDGVSFHLRFSSGDRERSDEETKSAESYDEAIEMVGKSYVRWRYIYEEFEDAASIFVSFKEPWYLIQAVTHSKRVMKGNTKVSLAQKEPHY